VSENRLLKRIFGSKWEQVAAGWRKLHNDEHHNLYTSLKIVMVIKSRKMKWARHVAYIREARIAQNFWLKNLKGGNHLEDYV
jgi:hypothetical protein